MIGWQANTQTVLKILLFPNLGFILICDLEALVEVQSVLLPYRAPASFQHHHEWYVVSVAEKLILWNNSLIKCLKRYLLNIRVETLN